MRSRRSHHAAFATAMFAVALVGSACFGGGQSSPQGTPTAPPAAAAAPSPAPQASPQPIFSPSPAASPSAPPAAARPSGPGEDYTVETGDTLATIANKFYGDAGLWRQIYDANKAALGDNPDAIKVGTQIKIPPKE